MTSPIIFFPPGVTEVIAALRFMWISAACNNKKAVNYRVTVNYLWKIPRRKSGNGVQFSGPRLIKHLQEIGRVFHENAVISVKRTRKFYITKLPAHD